MSHLQHTTPSRRFTWFVALLLSACPDYDDDGYWMQQVALPVDAQSATAEVTVVVPEGDWKLRIRGGGSLEVDNHQPARATDESHSYCGAACSSRDYVLSCPRGKCSFSFDTKVSGASLEAGIYFSQESEGCEPDPHYVPDEDRHLFTISFQVREVIRPPDAGSQGDAATADAGPMSHGLDGGIARLDAAVEVDAARDAGPLYRRGTFTDSRDDQRYASVTIGNQTWMAQNLNFGEPLPGLLPSFDPPDPAKVEKYCINDEVSECEKSGGLYTWAEALALPSGCTLTLCAAQLLAQHRGICPEGWHIPSRADWYELVYHLAGTLGVALRDEHDAWERAGIMLRATEGWSGAVGGTDVSGFSAAPTGSRHQSGGFSFVAETVNFQSADEGGADYALGAWFAKTSTLYGTHHKADAHSVRCVKDR
jgi:uncharacterized protein (TIGR02145 family)